MHMILHLLQIARRALPFTLRETSPRTEIHSHIRQLNQETSSTASRRRGVGYQGLWTASSPASTSALHSVAGGGFDCDSDQECELVYDDDVDVATETGHRGGEGKGVVDTGDASAAAVADERRLDGAGEGQGFREQGLEYQQKVGVH